MLAPDWLSPVLALEVAAAAWSPCPAGRYQNPRSAHQSGEPALGRASYSWRTAEARDRGRSADGSKYMAKRRPGSGQTWKTFLRNHASGIGAVDFLFVPTINFRLLFVLVILRHERRRLILLSATDHPTAEWIVDQITEAFPWDTPTHLIRDLDACYGHVVRRRLAAMSIRDHPIAPRSPWKNGQAERLIGSIRRSAWTTS